MKRILYSLGLLLTAVSAQAQHEDPVTNPLQKVLAEEKDLTPVAYKLFDHRGKSAQYPKMIKELLEADVVFFGELHNNPICHWLQLEVARDLYAQKATQLVLGAEMFETDDQLLINEYFLGFISQSSFEKEARLWPNYETDYKPLLEFAREGGLRFVATNVPRRYASMVFKEGLSKLNDLPDYSKIYFAPLPIKVDEDVACYKKMLEMGNGNVNFPHAQMIKDATMAHFILANWDEKDVFLHFNGAFHSDNKEGIIWYLQQLRPSLKIVVISTVEQEEIDKLDEEHLQKGDYIICVPTRMTKTH